MKRKSLSVPKSKITPLKSHSRVADITEKVQAGLDGLNIQMNSTLTRTIKSSESEQKTLLAIEAFKEAKSKGEVPNPTRFLVRAIKEGWMPSEGYEQKAELDDFNEWYPIAKSLKLVDAATQIDKVQHVLTIAGEWMPFGKMIVKYPLERLQEMSDRGM